MIHCIYRYFFNVALLNILNNKRNATLFLCLQCLLKRRNLIFVRCTRPVSCFFNNDKIIVRSLKYTPGIKALLDIMLWAWFLNTWAVSRPLKTGKIVFGLTMLRHPHPYFAIKENYLLCVWKPLVRICKLHCFKIVVSSVTQNKYGF